jgi:very-short-patch-repair endonuclease
MIKFIPYNKNLRSLARTMRNNPTTAEKIFWFNVLRNKDFYGYKFIRQKILLNYIVDFYCSELLLVIELDGESHIKNKNYDIGRSKQLESYGIKVIRYENNDILNSIDGVCDNLREEIERRSLELETKKF